MTEQRETDRPCPECESSGRGRSRIGNRRASCKTCNAFARRLERRVNARLRKHVEPATLEAMTNEAEAELYQLLMKGQDR